MEKPAKAAIGQRWKQMGCVWLVTDVDEKRPWPVKARLVEKPANLPGGNQVGFEDWGFRLESFAIGYEYLGSDTPSPRDWARWLPPGPLRELPDGADFRPGQIWACAGKDNGNKCVVLIGDAKPRIEECWDATYLAREGAGEVGTSIGRTSFFGRHAILVADVGCEPTPPEVLYAATPVTPPKPQVRANVVVDPSLQTKNRPGVDPYADGAFTFERGEKTRHPEGTPLTALQRIQAKPKPEPWVPSCDELFWIKDA